MTDSSILIISLIGALLIIIVLLIAVVVLCYIRPRERRRRKMRARSQMPIQIHKNIKRAKEAQQRSIEERTKRSMRIDGPTVVQIASTKSGTQTPSKSGSSVLSTRTAPTVIAQNKPAPPIEPKKQQISKIVTKPNPKMMEPKKSTQPRPAVEKKPTKKPIKTMEKKPSTARLAPVQVAAVSNKSAEQSKSVAVPIEEIEAFTALSGTQPTQKTVSLTSARTEAEQPDWGDSDEDFDAIYNLKQTKGTGKKVRGLRVLLHLLRQVGKGKDLSKVTLPTYVLERRSLLEMYADFFVHPDDFVLPNSLDSAEERFLAVVRYYLNSFLPARRTEEAKKPYNPVLGEIFRCRWTLPGTTPSPQKTSDGPFPGSSTNQVTFIGEQVNHHPPISAFYAEYPDAGISFTGQIYTKSANFLYYIAVCNIGAGILTLRDRGEHYRVHFPDAYARNLMGVPYVELGGKITISCPETKYRAEIEFLPEGFLFGPPRHQIEGSIFNEAKSRSKPMMRLKGNWKKVIFIKPKNRSDYQKFTNVAEKDEVAKECVPVMKQGERESRRLWRHVTAALFRDDENKATEAKRWIEQRQRDEQEERKKKGIKWAPRFFEKNDDDDEVCWRYKHDLLVRKTL